MVMTGLWAGEEPYAQDTQGDGGKEATQHNPYNIFCIAVSVFIFVFFLAE